jgi:hypothetical protein
MGRNGLQAQSAGRHGTKFFEEEKSSFGFKMMSKMGWEEGKGLGKNEHGISSFIRAQKKQDQLGIGAKASNDDTWHEAQGLFNDLLSRLNAAQKGEDGEPDFDPNSKVEAPSKSTGKALAEFTAKRRLYGRFRASKDAHNYSATDMAAIMGKKAPSDPFAKVAAQSGGGSSKPDEGMKTLMDRYNSPSAKFKSDIQTTSSRYRPSLSLSLVSRLVSTSIDSIRFTHAYGRSVSMKDYFAKKMAANTKQVTQFQVLCTCCVGSHAANRWGEARASRWSSKRATTNR